MKPPQNLAQLNAMIASKQFRLSPKLKIVLQHMLANPSEVCFASTPSLAHTCNVSPTTVSRVSSAVGFDEFKQFRELFRRDMQLRRNSRPTNKHISGEHI